MAFWPANFLLTVVQALCVLLPGAGLPAWATRLGGRWWALVLPASLVGCVVAISVLPGTADALTWLALVACPPLAAAALGWAARGSRPAAALLAVPLLAGAWLDPGSLLGEGCAVALSALSCVTLGRLIAGVTPLVWLKVGIVVMALLDTYLIATRRLQAPNAALNAAVPAPGLPQLQSASFGDAVMGYGDLFAASVLGAVVARERGRQWAVALLTFGLAELFNLLFLVTDELPATVPVALALLLSEAVRRRRPQATSEASAAARAGGGTAHSPA